VITNQQRQGPDVPLGLLGCGLCRRPGVARRSLARTHPTPRLHARHDAEAICKIRACGMEESGGLVIPRWTPWEEKMRRPPQVRQSAPVRARAYGRGRLAGRSGLASWPPFPLLFLSSGSSKESIGAPDTFLIPAWRSPIFDSFGIVPSVKSSGSASSTSFPGSGAGHPGVRHRPQSRPRRRSGSLAFG